VVDRVRLLQLRSSPLCRIPDNGEDQLNELRARIIEINEFTQYNLLTGEALGLIRGMLIDLVEASDADPDDYIDDLDRLDQIANQFP
jgi:hypothetical protein